MTIKLGGRTRICIQFLKIPMRCFVWLKKLIFTQHLDSSLGHLKTNGPQPPKEKISSAVIADPWRSNGKGNVERGSGTLEMCIVFSQGFDVADMTQRYRCSQRAMH